METADFEFLLPPDRVAAAPADARDDARLMVMDRRGVARKHLRFRDILAELPARSLLVLNDTRVLAARLRGRKATGGAVEFLLTQRMGNDHPAAGRQNARFCELWDGLTRGLSGTASAGAIDVGGDVSVEIVERREAGRALLRLTGPGPSLLAVLDGIGEVPLPPYIEAARRRLGAAAPAVDDRTRYQTVYAARAGRRRGADGGAALHARAAGGDRGRRSRHRHAHAGRRARDVSARGGRRSARAPTGFRALHHPGRRRGRDRAGAARAPARGRGRDHGRALARGVGARARRARSWRATRRPTSACCPATTSRSSTDLITNFHLPRSTLLMLVAAFAGKDNVLGAYREAVERGYRFYSYGDAMLIRSAAAA